MSGYAVRDDSWCTTREGRQVEVGHCVSIRTPVNFHAGYGTVTRLMPGGAGDVPCVMVRDAEGRLVVVNAVNVVIEEV